MTAAAADATTAKAAATAAATTAAAAAAAAAAVTTTTAGRHSSRLRLIELAAELAAAEQAAIAAAQAMRANPGPVTEGAWRRAVMFLLVFLQAFHMNLKSFFVERPYEDSSMRAVLVADFSPNLL
ncbi:hypothetical protein SVAN01_11829 [Stagonosporopsis vannaccii]|nr:hypothetical protein SVAN01_11829 [Stagonosporopsis vannaccii]